MTPLAPCAATRNGSSGGWRGSVSLSCLYHHRPRVFAFGEQRRSLTTAAALSPGSSLGSDTAYCQQEGAALNMIMSQLPCRFGEDNLAVPVSRQRQTIMCSAGRLPVPYAMRMGKSCVMCNGL